MTLSVKEFYGSCPSLVLAGDVQRKRGFLILVFEKGVLSDLQDMDLQLSLKALKVEGAQKPLWVTLKRISRGRSNALNRFLFKAHKTLLEARGYRHFFDRNKAPFCQKLYQKRLEEITKKRNIGREA